MKNGKKLPRVGQPSLEMLSKKKDEGSEQK